MDSRQEDSCKHPIEPLLLGTHTSSSDGFKPYPTQPSFTPVETKEQKKPIVPPPPNNPTAEDIKNFDIVRATQFGIYERVVELIENGYDVNQPDAENVTVLHWAAINNRKDVAKYYINQGAIIDKIGGDLNSTPLHWATRQGHLSMVVLLMLYGADPLVMDGEGCACIHLAAQFGHTAIVAYLIAKGTNINMQDKNGMTALMWSAYRVFNVDPTRLLLTFGASVSMTDSRHGNTPLHWCCTSANYSVVRLLIDKGANLTQPNNNGQNVLELCAEKKSQWLMEKILKAMAAQGIGNEMKGEMGVIGKLASNKTVKDYVIKITPFVLLFLIGFICNLSVPWWQKLLMFLCSGFVWRSVSSLFFDHSTFMSMSLYLYLATKFWMYVTWCYYYWPYVQDLTIQLPFAINTVFLAYYFLKVWKTDPGIIKNDRDGKFRTVIELAESAKLDFSQFCSTCIVRKPVRSKHCSMCNRCIARFDHHCPWVGNCIGAKNQKYFVGYLTFLMGMISWCFAGAVIYFQKDCSQLNFEVDGVFISLGRLMQCNAWVTWIAFNALVHFLWVGTILAAQLYQTVYLGVTTNEKINFPKYSKFHTGKKGVYKSPYNRGIIQNFVDLMEIRCFGLCRPAKTNWMTLYDEDLTNAI